MRHYTRGLSIAALLLTFGAGSTAYAQSAPHLSAHTFEVGGFVGSSYGLDEFRVMGGGNVTYGVTRWLLPYAEFSYFPGLPRELSGTFAGTGQPYTVRFNVPITDFHGGVHIRFPAKESRVVPYAVFGMGLLRSADRTAEAEYRVPDSNVVETLPIPVAGSTDFAINWGGGLRFYTRQNFGFRLEAKAYKPTGQFTGIFGKVEAGFFLQFR
jgi:hypothetical protein